MIISMILPGARILIVENDSTVRTMLKEWLEKKGSIVDNTDCPFSGLSFAGFRDYSLAVIGYSLRGMSGIELAGRLREIRPELPIIGMSGLWWVDEKFYGIGVRHFICKPFNLKTFAVVMENALQD